MPPSSLAHLLPGPSTIPGTPKSLVGNRPAVRVIHKAKGFYVPYAIRQLLPAIASIRRAVDDSALAIRPPGVLNIRNIQIIGGKERESGLGLPARGPGVSTIVGNIE